MIEKGDGRAGGAHNRGLRSEAGLHEHLLRIDARDFEQGDEKQGLVVAVSLAPPEHLLGAVWHPPLAADKVHVADVVGYEIE